MPTHQHQHRRQIAHVIDVDMGYGHSRAAYALKDLARGKVITANNYPGIPDRERAIWSFWRESYETLSRARSIPVVGKPAFAAVMKLQEIPDFYPRRDLSAANLAVKEAYRLIEKQGIGRDLTRLLDQNPLPAVCTHPVPAFALEAHGYSGPIWCLPTDADVARAWVARDPHQSTIKYFCANGRLVERLKLYGVRESQLFLTGFPLPKELIGGEKSGVLKRDLLTRLCNLDPKRQFLDRYKKTLQAELGSASCKYRKTHPLTILYAVGGAGAQRATGVQIIKSLALKLKRREVRLRLSAGTRSEVLDYYRQAERELKITRGIEYIFDQNRARYFQAFNDALRETDILWTKPSELAFYTALGIPIIMTEPLGRQEEFNAIWLTYVGGGIAQDDVRYASEWLSDWLDSGGLARAAWNGFIEAPTHGVYRIEDLLLGRQPKLLPPPLIV